MAVAAVLLMLVFRIAPFGLFGSGKSSSPNVTTGQAPIVTPHSKAGPSRLEEATLSNSNKVGGPAIDHENPPRLGNEEIASKEEVKPEERVRELKLKLDKAISEGDLGIALQSAGELARLGGADESEAKANLLLELETSARSQILLTNIAQSLLELLRHSVANGGDVTSDRLDQLVRASRKSGDSEVIRQSTLFVLAIRHKSTR